MSQSLKELQEIWYKKLKKSGFKDAEDQYGNLIEHHSFQHMYKDPLTFGHQQRYYELARQLSHTFSFKNSEQRTVWTLHTDGKSNKYIADKIDRTAWYVAKVIKEISKLIKV